MDDPTDETQLLSDLAEIQSDVAMLYRRKKSMPPEIKDGDGDGTIYDGTENERSADPDKLAREKGTGKPEDLTTSGLTPEDRERIQELMTPVQSEAWVEGGMQVDSFDELPDGEQDRLRNQFMMMMENDFDTYSTFTDRIRYHIEEYQMNDIYREVADEITVDADFVERFEGALESQIEEAAIAIAEENGVDVSDLNFSADGVYERASEDFLPDVGFVSENSDDFEEFIQEKSDALFEDALASEWPEYIEDVIRDTDMIGWANENGFEISSSEGLANMEFSETQVASMVGAPDDSTVRLTVTSDGAIGVTVVHDDWENYERVLSKEYGGWEMHHSHLSKSDSAGDNAAAKLLQRAIPNMAANGVDKISLSAAGSPGSSETGYKGFAVWPRHGFDYPVSRMTKEMQTKVYDQFPDAESVLDIYQTKEGRDWWWKNGQSMSGMEFDLSEGSRSMETFGRYLLYLDKKGVDFGN